MGNSLTNDNVLELAKCIYDSGAVYEETLAKTIADWVTRHASEQIVVGLTDGQIWELSKLMVPGDSNRRIVYDRIKEWHSTKRFTKIEEVSASDYNRLVDDYIELESIYSEQQKYLEQLRSDFVVLESEMAKCNKKNHE